MKYYYIEGNLLNEKKAAHRYIAGQLNFPDYYGNNLDALADCLSEMSYNNTIVISHSSCIEENLGAYGESLLEVFDEQSRQPYSFKLIVKK